MTFPTRFQPPPSSWKVTVHPHMSCKLLKFQAWEQFGEAISEVVMSGDVCIMDVSSFNLFMNIVMLNFNVLSKHGKIGHESGYWTQCCHSECRMNGLEHDLKI